MSTPQNRTATSTMIVMISTTVSRLLGFVRIAVVGAIFGASGEADVLNLVFNIPNNLRKLLAEGALSSAFIPVLSSCAADPRKEESGKSVFRSLLGFQLVILIPLLSVSVLFSRPIVNTILDFSDPAMQDLAVRLFRPLMQYVLFISIAAVLMGTLHAHSHFLVPSLAPLLFSVSVISSILFLHRTMGIFSMVTGVLIGGVLQIVVQIPSVRRLGYSISPGFDFRSSEFRTIVRRWLPVVSTSAVFTVNQQIALYFASGLADGSGSAMTNALTFWQLPFGIFSASVTTVLFPRMSREAAANDLEGFGKTVSGGITSLVLLLVPSGIGLLFLGHGIVSVALQRGAFLAVHTDLTARVLGAYGIGLFSVGAFTFLQRAYYSLGDYRTPLVTAACTVIVDVVFSLFLKDTYLGVTGLAWANTIAFTVGLVVFAVTLRARTRLIFTTKNLIRSGIAAIVGSGAGAFVVLGGSYVLTIFGMGNWWQSERFPVRAAILTVFVSASLFGVVFVYRLFGYTVRGIMQRNKS